MPFNPIILPHPQAPEKDPRYDGDSKYSKTTLPAGWKLNDTARALDQDLVFEKNVPVKLRDGVTILVDIFRPNTGDEQKVPALLVWSPYGKTGRGFSTMSALAFLDAGILPGTYSGLEKFEGPDPAFWCPKGYAIINVDPRGSYDSEGVQSCVPDKQLVNDSYDTIEWLAVQPWCNGKIGSTGNSQLAMSQYWMGESQAPHLAALAPWEGLTDDYRSVIARGGIFNMKFAGAIFHLMCGRDRQRDLAAEINQPGQDGLFREHGRDMAATPSAIKVPLYVTAAVGSVIHMFGSILAWKKASSKDKWLRVHGGQEWWDYVQHQDELVRFFDRYLKDIPNGWEETPKVRYQLLEYGPQSNPKHVPYVPAEDFPPKEMREVQAYLGHDGLLSETKTDTIGSLSYDSGDAASVISFTWKPEHDVGVVGLPRIKFFTSNDTEQDFTVYIALRKLDSNGKLLFQYCWPLEDLQAVASAQGKPVPQSYDEVLDMNTSKCIGPTGQIRASRRKVRAPKAGDEEDNLSLPGWPYHPHDEEQLVPPGTVVEIETGIWPANIRINKGESLRLDLTPVNQEFVDLPFMVGKPTQSANKGKQTFFFGAKYDSYLVIPTIPL
ncbi:related to acyl esterases [Melanopsichium pennsylvanicum]|uniref:Related to acyl esterases n=2 Tax=Melanopsichium pennsylvanicum TaxID=63383 RepID=A0AAJ5C8B1_9BASI|nr:x-pro dipeptidyl-peptidase c-terminal non-catalytic domain-containing protein [Melanopsichium pennsylvanicum 4]SNX87812.1 related to acyl esterases [Melanopsichium pennsylvanicum]